MKIIGITGGIACGKSTLCGTLRALGAPVWDADAVSRGLTAPHGQALPAIRRVFGDSVFCADGTLDRKALGAVVFNDASAREALNRITHPLIYADMERFVARHRQAGTAAVFLDIPLLFETGYDRYCDAVWCARLPAEIQLSRLMARDGLTREEALSRMASQMPVDEKARRSDEVIDTSGSIEESAALITALYKKI